MASRLFRAAKALRRANDGASAHRCRTSNTVKELKYQQDDAWVKAKGSSAIVRITEHGQTKTKEKRMRSMLFRASSTVSILFQASRSFSTFDSGQANHEGHNIDLKYDQDHMWVNVKGSSAVVGITEHLKQSIGTPEFVCLPVVGATVTKGGCCSGIEFDKAMIDLSAPVSGEVIEVNHELNDSPNLMNDPYGKGWIMKVKLSNACEVSSLMDEDQYAKFCQGEARTIE